MKSEFEKIYLIWIKTTKFEWKMFRFVDCFELLIVFSMTAACWNIIIARNEKKPKKKPVKKAAKQAIPINSIIHANVKEGNEMF